MASRKGEDLFDAWFFSPVETRRRHHDSETPAEHARRIWNAAILAERARCAALCDEAMDFAVMSCYSTATERKAARDMAERIKRMIEEVKE